MDQTINAVTFRVSLYTVYTLHPNLQGLIVCFESIDWRCARQYSYWEEVWSGVGGREHEWSVQSWRYCGRAVRWVSRFPFVVSVRESVEF